MMYRLLLLCLFVTNGTTLFAQHNLLIKGKVLDSNDHYSLPGATILLINQNDTIQKSGTITNEKGDFQIKVQPGQYDFQISFVGYNNIKKSITVGKEPIDLGQFKLIENSKYLQEISITETLPPTLQKGDTTVFNPQAFKVNPDATAGELLAKMPGFYEVDGKLMMQGQEIAEILIDGKKFFGNNTNQALQTIPNDVIKNIEVFEYKSDESKFSGFKDKEEKKSVNIVTNRNKKRLLFGDVAAGIGKEEKFGFNGNINSFSDNNSITITGSSKNVNAPLSLNNRTFGSRGINGNDIQDDEIGVNFATSKNKNELNFSYEYGNNEYENESNSIKTYTSQAFEGQIQNTTNNSDSDRGDHRINLRLSLNSFPKSRILSTTSISSSDANLNSNSHSDTYLNGRMINANTNLNNSESKNYRIAQDFNISQQLGKRGRNLSLQAGFNYGKSDSNGKQLSETLNESEEVSQSIKRISDSETKDVNLRAGLSYSEPVGEDSQLSIGYNVNYNKGESDKFGYNFDENTNSYSQLDELTTNQFENSEINNIGRVSYNLQNEKHGISFGSDFELTTLRNEETTPNQTNFKKNFFALAPNARYSFNLGKQKRINLNYNSRTTTPSVRDLQEIVDLSNPLYISTGNSNLEQARTHSLMAFYSASNIEKGRNISIHTIASKTNNLVGRRTIVAVKDTTINDKYFLPAGGQFSQPVNLDGQYTISTGISYSLPVKKLKSKVNINTRGNFSHNPTLVNNKKAFTNSWNLNHDMVLSSNINEKLDFTLSSTSNYLQSKNNTTSGSEYISQTTSLNMYWNFYKNIVFRTNASNNYQNNLSTNKEDNFWHLNLGLSTKVFKSKRGEISLSAYDILNKKDERSHIATDLYTADYYTNKLSKFYMLSFSYKLRDDKGRPNRGRERFYEGMSPNGYRM